MNLFIHPAGLSCGAGELDACRGDGGVATFWEALAPPPGQGIRVHYYGIIMALEVMACSAPPLSARAC